MEGVGVLVLVVGGVVPVVEAVALVAAAGGVVPAVEAVALVAVVAAVGTPVAEKAAEVETVWFSAGGTKILSFRRHNIEYIMTVAII